MRAITPTANLQTVAARYLGRASYFVLHYLRSLPPDANGRRRATMARICEDLGCAHTTVVRSMRELKAKGYLLIAHGYGRGNAYELLPPRAGD